MRVSLTFVCYASTVSLNASVFSATSLYLYAVNHLITLLVTEAANEVREYAGKFLRNVISH